MKYTTWKKLTRKIDDEMWSFQKIYFLHEFSMQIVVLCMDKIMLMDEIKVSK
jgi:hypothetical protein